jgi:hypothetical protein
MAVANYVPYCAVSTMAGWVQGNVSALPMGPVDVGHPLMVEPQVDDLDIGRPKIDIHANGMMSVRYLCAM